MKPIKERLLRLKRTIEGRAKDYCQDMLTYRCRVGKNISLKDEKNAYLNGALDQRTIDTIKARMLFCECCIVRNCKQHGTCENFIEFANRL